MITLHGIYDNGKIIISEKELPKIKAQVEVIIKNTEPSVRRKLIHKNFYRTKGKLLLNNFQLSTPNS